ncbi:MAG: ABC transporter substrate-binding protein [Gammaproteobacteria bacterium]|nr:MAG: ABC transporter substrate-binding protein [Gammaproteobacteria bacterium]
MNIRSSLMVGLFALSVTAPLISGAALAANNTLTVADRASFKDWDPASAFSEEVRVLGNIYETLVVYNSPGGDQEFSPGLATSWKSSDDGKTWTFKLRKGVKFHDGSDFNAAAAKKSIEYTKGLKKGAWFVWAGLESIEAPADDTLVLKFNKPTAADLIASGQYATYMIAPAAVEEGHDWLMAPNAIGTGPYKLGQVEHGQQVVLERFTDYWGGWKESQFDRVILKVVSEAATRTQMINSGEADVAWDIPTDQFKTLEDNPSVKVTSGPSWKNYQFLLNTQKYPTDNLKFRQALQHLWDYDSVVYDVLYGYGTVPTGPLPSNIWGHSSFPMSKYDLNKAQELLEASGVPRSDWKVSMQYIGSKQAYANAAELFQATAAQVGVEVELLPGEWGVIWDKAKNLESSANLQSMGWWPAYPTPSDWLYSEFRTEKNALFNLSHYSNETFDRLLDEGMALEGSDRAKASEKYAAAQKQLVKDAPAIWYADMKQARVSSASIKGMEKSLSPAYEAIFYYHLSR